MITTVPAGSPLAPYDELEWTDYVDWLNAQPPAGHHDDLFIGYLNHMAATGVAPRRICATMDALFDRLEKDTTAWRPIFNNVYRSTAPRYSTRPNAFLAEVIGALPPRRALEIAMGQGRNALFLARTGWRVTGFDIADAGLAAARAGALASELDVTATWCSQQSFYYGVDSWDLVVATYCPLALDDGGVVAAVTRALRPGGLLLVEAFSRTQDAGPPRIGATLDSGTLAAAFGDLTVVHAEEAAGTADWSEGDAHIVRFLARRPSREDVR